jgi:molybdopterin-guanine dinucleotide biosynthesis protein A
MGGNDKAFIPLAGRPLIEHVIERLRPQVELLAISSNAPSGHFANYGLPVLPDVHGGFRGPLAGIHAGLHAWPDAIVLTVAVDLPLLPRDLVARLRAALRPGRCAYAANAANHAIAILWSPGMAPLVERVLLRGDTAVRDWLETHGDAVMFAPAADTDVSFNVNSPRDLERAEQLLTAHRTHGHL